MAFIASARGVLLRAAHFLFTIACLAGFAASAQAGVPATIQPAGCYAANGCHYFAMNDIAGYRGETPQKACDNFAQTVYAWVGPVTRLAEGTATNAGYNCYVYASNGGYVASTGIYYAGRIATVSSCPAHSTLDGGGATCSCDPGYFPDPTQTQCVASQNRITLVGASRTKALVAGPALAQTARVTNTAGAGQSAISVTITIARGGTVSGLTNHSGEFEFTYVPPARAANDHLTATCSNCVNVAEKDIAVDPCDVCEPTVGNPVQPASGEKLQTDVDWIDSSSHPLTVARTYRSFGAPWAGLGATWSLPWAATAVVMETEAWIRLGDGRRVNFRRVSTQQPWAADASADSLVATSEGFRYRRASDGVSWDFDAQGRLLRIVERSGWAMSVQRDASGRVAYVANAFGRSLAFTYDGANRLSAITTPDGGRIGYSFDSVGNTVAVVYPDGTSRTYLYDDGPGLLTGVVDERGIRVATFGYDANGWAVSTQHAGAQSFSVVYGQSAAPRGQLVAGTTIDSRIYRAQATVADPLGTPRTYEWVGGDGHVYLVGATAPGGISAFASRGIEGLPTHQTDFAGVTTTFAWDPVRRLKVQQTEALGHAEARTTATEWHPVFDLPVRIAQPGRVTEYGYDPLGNKLSETITDTATGQARTRSWTYTPGSLVASETDEAGRTTRFGYDAVGNRTSVTDAAGQVTTYAFDAAGRVTSRNEPGGLVTAYVYDLRGRLLSQTRAGEATTFGYTATGQLARVVTANGYDVTFGYDAADRLVAATDSRGTSIAYTLDGAGNRVREEVKDANGNVAFTVLRGIDGVGRVASVQGAAGQMTQYGYDANGEATSTTDPLQQTTRQALDALRRTTSSTFPDNASAQQAWNALDAVTQVTDPKGVRTQYAVNAFGEVTSESSPDAGTTTYQRNAAGEVVAVTDARGNTANITRDALGRVEQVRYADQTQSFSYDAQGQVSTIEDGSGKVAYVRDAQGRILTKTQTVNDIASSPSKYVVQYGYTAGDLANVGYPSGLQVSYRRTAGRITQVDVQAPGKARAAVAFVTGLAYTGLGQPKAWNWFNGDSAARSFDGDGRMVANEFASYGYDAAGRITAITQQLWVNAAGVLSTTPVSWTVGYDSRSRIASMNRDGHGASFTYDANSNRLSKLEISTGRLDLEGQFDAPAMSLTTSETPRIDAGSNRMLGFEVMATASDGARSSTSSSEVRYALDAAGNMTSDGLRTFVYDASNRLSKVLAVRHGEAVGYEYLHNALGQRVFKSGAVIEESEGAKRVTRDFTDWLRDALGWIFKRAQGGKSRNGLAFVYDEQGNLLATYGNGSNKDRAEQMEFIWLPLEDGTSIPVGVFKDGQLYAVHADHLGTARLITDKGKVPVWQWLYSAFGANRPTGVLKAMLSKTASGAVAQHIQGTEPGIDVKLRFPGQYWDGESNLAQNWWREYNARNGRYIESDPIGLAGGINTYLYGDGEPTRKIDREGLTTFMCTKPLHAFGDKWGPRMYPESRFNPSPFYHQYMCVPDGKGGMTCGGQDRAEGAYGPGKPSTDSFEAGVCKPVDENKCVEQCVLREVSSPDRPPYALIGGAGGRNGAGAANCQQWADRKLRSCQQQCKAR